MNVRYTRVLVASLAATVLLPSTTARGEGENLLSQYHEFIMVGERLSAAPDWIRGVKQDGGSFMERPERWVVDAGQKDGTGSLLIQLNREKLQSDVAITVLSQADADGDFSIQLLDDQERVVLVDLVGNVTAAAEAHGTRTFVVPLARHPTGTQIAIRRVSGPVVILGIVIFPVLVPAEEPGDMLDQIDLLKLLGAPLSTNSPTWQAISAVLSAKAASASTAEGTSGTSAATGAAAAKISYTEQTSMRPGRVVAYDDYHGHLWPGADDFLTQLGMSLRPIAGSIDDDVLRGVDVFIMSCVAYTTTTSIAEVDAVARFVRDGGSLLCAGQVWSWAYPEYGNRPANEHPFNQIGKQLGFEVTGFNVGAPTYFSTELMNGVSNVVRRDWWPSKIQFTSPSAQPIIRDDRLYPIAGCLTYGRGRVIVVGHDAMLADNPGLLMRGLSYLTARPE